jgi:hypothetical protein
MWAIMGILFFNTSLVDLILPILSTEDIIITVLVMGVLVLFILFDYTFQQVSSLENRLNILMQNMDIENYFDKENPPKND